MEHQNERLLEELLSGQTPISDEKFRSHKFLVSTMKTIDALTVSVGREKYDLIKRMYFNGIRSNLIDESPSSYIELLNILSELSEREIHLLVEVDRWESKAIASPGKEGILEYLCTALSVDILTLQGIISRAQRTGLFLPISVPGGGVVPKLSGMWTELKDLMYLEEFS